MTFPYLVKLACLCLACFFLAHLALAGLVRMATPAALRIAERMRPGTAARFLFALRVAPAGFSLLIVAAICAPSYLWLEPTTAADEQVGPLCVALSAMGLALWAVSIGRGIGAITRSVRYLRRCEAAGRRTDLPGGSLPAWLMEEPAPLFAVGGMIRPRLFISRSVRNALSDDQLGAAIRHERAHWISRDNLKRLFILLAPDLLPFLRGFQILERGWARFTERAADDCAAAGDAARSLALASALLRVSRLASAPQPAPLMAPLLAGDDDLAERVRRLLRTAPPAPDRAWPWIACSSALVALAGSLVLLAVAFPAPLLVTVNRFLEYLIQ